MSVGRVGVYIHSDSVSPDKGACIVVIETTTDFAARTTAIKAFADRVARIAYGVTASLESNSTYFRYPKIVYKKVVELMPEIEIQRLELESEYKEKIRLSQVKFVKV